MVMTKRAPDGWVVVVTVGTVDWFLGGSFNKEVADSMAERVPRSNIRGFRFVDEECES